MPLCSLFQVVPSLVPKMKPACPTAVQVEVAAQAMPLKVNEVCRIAPAVQLAPSVVLVKTLPLPAAKQVVVDGTQETAFSCAVVLLVSTAQVLTFVVARMVPPAPTATHKALLAQETPSKFWVVPLACAPHEEPLAMATMVPPAPTATQLVALTQATALRSWVVLLVSDAQLAPA